MKQIEGIRRSDPLYFRQSRPILQLAGKAPVALAHGACLLFLLLALCTPAWRAGPFAWWPVWRSSLPTEQPAAIGLLVLLLPLWALAWALARLLRRQGHTWQWGAATLSLPLLLLSILIVLGLEPGFSERTIVQTIGLALLWFTYLYVLNERPPLTVLLWVVVLVQAGVALAQFARQRDLGLAFLGEAVLDRQVQGTSVLWSSSQEAWLRGYGLTAHPNVLGAMLAVLLLVLLARLSGVRGWRQGAMAAGLAVGTLGLLVSFSRTGWLAFAAGLVYWLLRSRSLQVLWRRRFVLLPLILVASLFFLRYQDLILGRWLYLDTLIEARSIQERLRDAWVALQLIADSPFLGVGAGNAETAAQLIRADAAAVHNVPLLATVELGVLGGIGWLVLVSLPFAGVLWRSIRPHGYAAVWVGVLVAGLFDTALWLTTSWRAALLLGLLAALQAQSAGVWREELEDAHWL